MEFKADDNEPRKRTHEDDPEDESEKRIKFLSDTVVTKIERKYSIIQKNIDLLKLIINGTEPNIDKSHNLIKKINKTIDNIEDLILDLSGVDKLRSISEKEELDETVQFIETSVYSKIFDIIQNAKLQLSIDQDTKDTEFYNVNLLRIQSIPEDTRKEKLITLRSTLEQEIKSMSESLNLDTHSEPKTCYVLITTHGMVDNKKHILIPVGKEIIKKNIASCGYFYVQDIVDFFTLNTKYTKWFNDLKTDIVASGESSEVVRDNYNRLHHLRHTHYNKTSLYLPNMMSDTTHRLGSIMRDKLAYYNKTYSYEPDEVENVKHVPLLGITLCIDNINYNIMHKSEMERLISTYSVYINADPYRRMQHSKILEYISGFTLFIDDPDLKVYKTINTEFLFTLFSILPCTSFIILDASCHTVISTNPDESIDNSLTHPSFISYDYSDENPIGFGGTIKLKNKYTIKKQKHKKSKKRYIKNNIKRSRINKFIKKW